MLRLRDHPIIAARDFYYSWYIYEEEIKLARGAGYFSRLWDCFAVPRIRRANYGASTVMIAQQMCGINSKSPLVSCQWAALTHCSHLILQLNDLRGRRLYCNSGIVRVAGLWRYSGSGHYPNVVPHRHQRPKDPDLGGKSLRSLRAWT